MKFFILSLVCLFWINGFTQSYITTKPVGKLHTNISAMYAKRYSNPPRNQKHTNLYSFDSTEFSRRYFFTSNALPFERGAHFASLNILGPDIQIGLGRQFQIGITTSWLAFPALINLQKSWQLNVKTHLAIGTTAGTGTYFRPKTKGILPFATLTLGDHSNNLSITGGYTIYYKFDIFDNSEQKETGPSISVSGSIKLFNNTNVVFDSYIFPPRKEVIDSSFYTGTYYQNDPEGYKDAITDENYGFTSLYIGLRHKLLNQKSLQLGISLLILHDGVVIIPYPLIQWIAPL
ncbi:hypothetical protein SAMN05216474_1676 [Lishizhenia tianjinensis]|uniref:MetA-pathway of phenol degradation n=1 Tax=Lishizhenia tianjinensis TaxID=477690 RepID=A0A1I6ZWG8_9FLAO|nr:hypothetical protein [Lishizhenia tianjinensis]SFT67038.1 hypothetical protein SAMN05216474_1676 [Lishizhenia tianjinensis]